MKNIIVLICLFHTCNILCAQNNFQLLAEKKNKTRTFKTGAAIKIIYSDADTLTVRKGRIIAIKEDSIILRNFKKTDEYHLSVTQIQSVRKIRRGGRVVTGAIGVGVTGLGISIIADDLKRDNEFLDGLGVAVGTLFIVSSFIPYIIVAATEPVSTIQKGYTFSILKNDLTR